MIKNIAFKHFLQEGNAPKAKNKKKLQIFVPQHNTRFYEDVYYQSLIKFLVK
jgi:hypothetical protein